MNKAKDNQKMFHSFVGDKLNVKEQVLGVLADDDGEKGKKCMK